ncbi:MAG: putative toxin-antitoxin system toxin component, PIN family [Gemmatimonadales bacterium]
MKVYLDTNVVVSAVATRGLCADLFHVILADHELMLGETVLTELRRVLARRIGLPKETIRELEAFLRGQATVVSASPGGPRKRLDPANSRVLAEATTARADVFVTGDRELLEVPDSPVEIVSPRGLWERFRSTS